VSDVYIVSDVHVRALHFISEDNTHLVGFYVQPQIIKSGIFPAGKFHYRFIYFFVKFTFVIQLFLTVGMWCAV